MTATRAALVAAALGGILAAVPAATAARSSSRLIATVGFGQITLKNERGKTIKSLRAGRYTIDVVDRSSTQNFHLVGKGVNVRTKVAFEGTKTWSVRFRNGTRVKYFSDAAPRALKGSFVVR